MKKLYTILYTLIFVTSLQAQFTGGGASSGSNNNTTIESDAGVVWFLGMGLNHGWAKGEDLEIGYVIPPISLFYEVKIDDKMSWGLGTHIGYTGAFYSLGFESADVNFTHSSVYGKYYYHFLPREMKFNVVGVGTLGYAFVFEEIESGYAPSGGFKLGIAGQGRVKLGNKFGFFTEIGLNGISGHVQAGICFGNL